ncbi:Bud site selection protein, Revert to axial protein 1 [Aspergillus alliaceus]|uniref:Bud site selection protein, Revert to axial protein 1 n=1 Tax=Petromyces alliaceus TaxID=209559 RepID=A0A5N7C1B9_PETAA|nr:RGS domain-containing protein [Aspergillus alliaceus]KAB8236254.1 RGS domain-containing protein [Aspergillus alliaceus]KAE8387875.1 RGS domain-containing protein [Aspergillus alliaceus]KAF5862563.1 Bud site selection protein, Revert to axial protein 1 [Aspergillus burnettii]
MASPSLTDLEQRNRLPTLFEVLSRRTLAPVDLFSFYIYMRDQQRSVDYLDFWLDVSQHMSLCRHYVRELRRSVLVATPDLEKADSKGSSDALGNLDNFGDIPLVEAGPSGLRHGNHEPDDQDADQRLSAFLRSDGHNSGHSPQNSIGSQNAARTPSNEQLPRASSGTRNDSTSPGHTVARADIRASAEKILYTYLLPGAEREIVLPEDMVSTIISLVEDDGRDDPEVFDPAKDYVFQAMERDAFPGFLQAKALGNLVPLSIVARLAFALISFGGGFWGAFYVVLRDKPRHIRCWLILPFLVASYFIVSYQYKIDPVMAFLGYSEYTFMNWSQIREPYVRKLLNKRSTATLLIAAFVAAALSILFIFVPGTML